MKIKIPQNDKVSKTGATSKYNQIHQGQSENWKRISSRSKDILMEVSQEEHYSWTRVKTILTRYKNSNGKWSKNKCLTKHAQ
jgi:hypothetical protein